jgi:hypothetical protein
MQRISAAAFILFATTAGCSHNATTSERPLTTATAPSTTLSPSVSVFSTQAPPAEPRSPNGAAARRTATTRPVQSDSTAVATASEFVSALLSGQAQSDQIDVDLWQATLNGGRIIQTATLHGAADRATVAISIAFETPLGGEGVEPIGLRIELRATRSDWTVDGIGYL